MTLTEDDKDLIIKLLARQIILYQENSRLRKLLSDNEIKFASSLKSVKKDERELNKHVDANTKYEIETSLNDDAWDSIADGSFDEQLDGLLQTVEEREEDEKKTESEDENDECS